jgi:hypothetical protein
MEGERLSAISGLSYQFLLDIGTSQAQGMLGGCRLPTPDEIGRQVHGATQKLMQGLDGLLPLDGVDVRLLVAQIATGLSMAMFNGLAELTHTLMGVVEMADALRLAAERRLAEATPAPVDGTSPAS